MLVKTESGRVMTLHVKTESQVRDGASRRVMTLLIKIESLFATTDDFCSDVLYLITIASSLGRVSLPCYGFAR